MNGNNEKRLIAAQIIYELFVSKDVGQLELLRMQAERSLEELQKEVDKTNPASKLMKETVKSLREKGWKVKCFHTRNPQWSAEVLRVNGLPFELGTSPKGGKTKVHLIDSYGVSGYGVAVCSEKENYCRKTGVAIALGRALKDWGIQNEAYQKSLNETVDKSWRRLKPLLDSLKDAKEAYKKQWEEHGPKAEPSEVFLDVMNNNLLQREGVSILTQNMLNDFLDRPNLDPDPKWNSDKDYVNEFSN